MPWAHNLVGLTQTGDRIFKSNALGLAHCTVRLTLTGARIFKGNALAQAHSIFGLTQTDDWFFKGHALRACITLLVGLRQVTACLKPCSRRTTLLV